MGDTETYETVADERIVFARPFQRDVVCIYKIRYTAIRTREQQGTIKPFVETTYRSEYGGFNDVWTEFEGFEVLRLEPECGVIVLDGRDGINLLRAMGEFHSEQLRDRESIVRLRDQLDRWLALPQS